MNRIYVSRVENSHTVPSIETLEKLARGLEIPLYQLFYEGEEPPKLPNLLKRKVYDDNALSPVKKLVAALIATGWSEPVPGRVYSRWTITFSRRTR